MNVHIGFHLAFLARLVKGWAGAGVGPACRVSGLDSGNFRNDRLRRLARIFRLRHRAADDKKIRSGGNGGGGRHRSFLAVSFGARWPDHEDHLAPEACAHGADLLSGLN